MNKSSYCKPNRRLFPQVLLAIRRSLEKYSDIVIDPIKIKETVAKFNDILLKHSLDGMNLQLDDG